MEIACIARCENLLGEGPLWDADRGLLFWVDIAQRVFHWLEPDSGKAGSWPLTARASAMALREDGTLLLATDCGFAIFDARSGKMRIRMELEPERGSNRTNDGHADGNGRFWIGTMHAEAQARSGGLYRLDPDWTCTRVLDRLGIPNTVLCTHDGGTLFLADSKDAELYSFAVNSSGALERQRLFARTREENCTPDGSALDEHGYLWNAQWGGSRIVRYAPDGSVDRVVRLPVEQPTSCVFGGSNLSTLFITSAREGLSAEALARRPLSGNVFAFDPGVRGVPAPLFRG
jgi:L-arabinonolactonase